MKNLLINIQVTTDPKTHKSIYIARHPKGQPSGFCNAYNMIVSGKQAKRLEKMLDIDATIYAIPTLKTKSGFKFIQY
jgi:hypothetical protein